MTDKLVLTRDGAVATITFNRPSLRNAVDAETMIALREALVSCGDDGTIRVIVLAGSGGAFCSGADLGAATQPGATAESAWRVLSEVYHPALLATGSRGEGRAIRWALEPGYESGLVSPHPDLRHGHKARMGVWRYTEAAPAALAVGSLKEGWHAAYRRRSRETQLHGLFPRGG